MIDPVLPTYARADVAFERGEGAYVYGTDGRRFLDFSTGIAVLCLGHSHPHMVQELQAQVAKLMHTSNLFHIPGQERLAERLVANTFADTVFFTNSGAEANECAIKMVRKYHSAKGNENRYRIITVDGAFHGRTLTTIAAGGGEKLLAGFGPKVDGFDQVPFGDLDAMRAAIGPDTAGILLEPIIGEGGIKVQPDGYLEGIRALCDEHDLLMVLDEVQTGMGRTGKLLGHEWTGATPDIVALGKGIGGGFPVGACAATERAASAMTAGSHGSTYGGNPLAMAAGNAVLDVILEDGFLDHVVEMGDKFKNRLEDLRQRNDNIFEEVRGRGLHLGVKCRIPAGDVVTALRNAGMLVVPAAEEVIRILPPLNITEKEIDEAIGILEDVCRELGA